jgi:hypothetical protein
MKLTSYSLRQRVPPAQQVRHLLEIGGICMYSLFFSPLVLYRDDDRELVLKF